jgi:6-phosphofructokinase 1
VVDVDRYYNKKRLRPLYKSFDAKPLFIMTSDY